MFSGIIEAQGEIRAAHMHGDCMHVQIALPRGWKFKKGDSVSVDGICSTVVAFSTRVFDVEYMPETLRVTTAKYLVPGQDVNLEQSLRYGDQVHGHFVQGHVDAVGTVTRIVHLGDSTEITFSTPRNIEKYVAAKGSITLNGVSLTIAKKKQGECTVALIPHTLASTNLGTLQKGDTANIETDMLARQLAARTGKV